ncbi:MAG: hypothetical protein EHM23_23305 [Acidobacteria bacterium]|nr:MAG: hypothetical protein EHM23_23305 [Acidobacteriota bacterium]
MVVVDGLNLLSEEERSLLEVERLIEAVRQRSLIGVLIYEGDCQASEHLDYLADMIIELRAEEIDGPPRYFVQKLCIIKSRFQQSVLGWHQYKIRNQTGINVFPSTHFYVHRRGLLNERIEDSMTSLASSSADVKSLNENSKLAHILGGYLGKPALKQGSSTVVLGARRTWKTMLTLDFLRAGSSSESHKEHCLLVSVMDNQSTITNEPRSLCELCCVKGRDKKQREDDCSKHRACYENIYLLHFRPGCISPSEFFHHLHKRLEIGRAIGKPISRLVFWDLTQLEYRFPLIANDRLFIPALIDYLKHSSDPITSVFMGAANSELSRAASAIADNVVFCWRDIRTCDDNGNSVGTTGFVFHVDRLEGHPESGSLFFLSESGDGHIDPVIDSDRQIEAFDYAESMREQIWAMQGLPAKSHSR